MNSQLIDRPNSEQQHQRYNQGEMNNRPMSEAVGGQGNQLPELLHQQMHNLQIDRHSPYHSPYPHDDHHFQPLSQPFTPYPHQQSFQQYPSYPYSPYGEPVWHDPRSEHASPINPSAQAFGMWSSPPMSPHPASFQPQPRHGSVDEYAHGQSGFYSRPPSNWTTPTMPSTFGFYPQYQPQPPQQVQLGRPIDQSHQSPRPPHHPNRVSLSGPSRPVRETSPDQTKERKVYHPQAPTGRSDWVMWVGNVPSNTSHEELWRYFNTTIPTMDPVSDTGLWRGPSSIFLISRSSCAFVNLSSQADLDRAVAFFNGRQLRPWDNRCPRMVCRIRRKDDDLRSGVGAQRGTGMHREWAKQQENKITLPRQISDTSVSSTSSVPPSPAVLEHPPDGEGRRRESIIKEEAHGEGGRQASSASFASTNSSFLARHFPRRIFILKSMTTRELEESVQTSTWRTQRHNEPILDQAFRTSQEVYLIFGANRSGEFFGYAKMVEPIDKDKDKAKKTRQRSTTVESDTREAHPLSSFLSPSLSHVPQSSPGEITPGEEYKWEHAIGASRTDPSDLRNMVHDDKSVQSAPEYKAQTLDPKALRREHRERHDYFPPVPLYAVSGGQEQVDHQAELGGSGRAASKDDQGVLRKDTALSPEEKSKRQQGEQDEAQDEFLEDGSGHTFRIEWIKAAPLNFNKTRHLRNPWNADREVKVSRDGTEVEPTIGSQLMAEWDKLDTVL